MPSSVICVLLFAALVVGPGASSRAAQWGRIGCPHCQNDGSEMSQLLQKADAFYLAFKPDETQKELLKALRLDPRNHEVLSKLARVHIDFGDRIPEAGPGWQEKRMRQYSIAEDYARRAIEADAESTWGYFYVAFSLGKIAVLSPIPKQIELSREIQGAVEKAIALDPENGYAYHLYGVWHRRMAEIGQMKRALASVLLWRPLPSGSMEKSVEYLKKAIALDPGVISHHLELAKTYVAMNHWHLARSSLKPALELPVQFSDDRGNRREAQQLLQEIRGR